MPEQNPGEIKESVAPSRRANALPVFALILIAIFAISYKPSIEAVYCNAKTLSPKPEVIMLGASWCPYCYKARKYFVDNNVTYCEYDIEDNGKGEQMYARLNSNPTMPLGIPVLFIGDYKFSGFDENSVEKLLLEPKPL